ncbi:MAG: hypothetical protein VX278_19455 [Myxococcota bacterium]|nr:hypothetical protein [Myxococcota bacterium]
MFFLFGCAPKPVQSDPQIHMVLQDLFEAHIMAIGGRQSFLEKKNLFLQGKIQSQASPIPLRFRTSKIAPSHIKVIIENASGQLVERGFDGSQAWENQRILGEEEKKRIERNSDFYFPLTYKDWYPESFHMSEAQFAGRPCTVILTKNRYKDWEELYFDKESKLLLGHATWKEEGETKHWYRYGHYTLIGGTKHPFTIEERKGAMHKVILIEFIRWNELIDTIEAPKESSAP